MLRTEELARLLSDRRMDKVSKATGIHRNTLMLIRDGKNTNPSKLVRKALSDYFSSQGDA